MEKQKKGVDIMTFYEVLCALGNAHVPLFGGYSDGMVFNLKEKSVRIHDTYLMINGKPVPCVIDDYFVITEDMELIHESENPYEELDNLYSLYKYSVPTEYSKYTKSNFIAVDGNELTHEQFEVGMSREASRINLEAFVLLTKFPWENENHFYHKGNSGVVLYKEWRN